jgi:hypothetical protein
MIRLLIAVIGLALVGSMVGCHAEGDVHNPNSATQVMPGR